MKVSFGPGSEFSRNLVDIFGRDEVTVQEILTHVAPVLGFDPNRVDVLNNSVMVSTATLVGNTASLVLVPKANTKG